MKKILFLMMFVFMFNSGLLAQVSIAAFITPRIEKEITKEVQQAPRCQTKFNTYATINGNFQKNQFFIEAGFGFQQKFNQTITRQGVVYSGGGSGELQGTPFLNTYNFNYTNLQSKLNAGYMFKKDKLTVDIGFGLQTEYLLSLTNSNTRLLYKPKRSFYLKINPRIALNDNLFIEFNNAFGFSKNTKPHVSRILPSVNTDLNYFYEAGIGIGFTFNN